MNGTELAARMGMHQSSVSRILSTLQAARFVRNPDRHPFAVDSGSPEFAIVELGVNAGR